MKVNTDGVLLGALADASNVETVLDIGAGTGVIALMLAQRFPQIQIDAVELDEAAAQTASLNFKSSPFAERLQLYALSFQQYFVNNPHKKYNLIVSNPPFYIQSLPSPVVNKNRAKHADDAFFEQLIATCVQLLSLNGAIWLILPLPTAVLVKNLANKHGLFIQQIVHIQSYPQSIPHREILIFSSRQTEIVEQRLIIYKELKVYTNTYESLLKDFLTIF
jgi:tRNA1Val (adenine37-N6)-methyltransferase